MDPLAAFCPNMDCVARGHTQRGNIKIHCHKRQRYRCTECSKTFSERRGTVFQHAHTPSETITLGEGLAAELPRPFYSCEAVLTEAHFLLSSIPLGTQHLIELVARGGIDFSFSYAEHATRIGELMMRYADVPMSFADACLVCMAEQTDSSIVTFDHDFWVYRKHRDQG